MKRRYFALALVALTGGCGILGGKEKPTTPTVGERVAVLTAETGLEVDPALADVAVTLPAPVDNADWAQPGGNAAKALGHVALPGQFTRAWSVSIGQGGSKRMRLAAPPVIANGRVYVTDTAAVVTAFDARTGAQVWRTSIAPGSGGNQNMFFGGGVSAEGDRVYATSGVGDVAALNAADGSQIWKSRPGGPLRGSPTIANDNVYVVSQDNQLYALNPADGTVRWTGSGTLEQAGVFGAAAPAAAQGTVVAGYSSGELTAYRYENGRVVWQDALARTSISTSVSALSDIDAEPVIADGRVYAIGQGGRMVAMELVTGQRIWELNIASIATPWVAGDWVFVVTDDARLMAISRATGKAKWITQLSRYRKEKSKSGPLTWRGPVLAGGRLIVVSNEGAIAQVSPADGSVQSTVETSRTVSLSPVVAGGTLYILDDDGQLSAWR